MPRVNLSTVPRTSIVEITWSEMFRYSVQDLNCGVSTYVVSLDEAHAICARWGAQNAERQAEADRQLAAARAEQARPRRYGRYRRYH